MLKGEKNKQLIEYCLFLKYSKFQIDKLFYYIEQLILWNQKINLVAKNQTNNLYNRHILDCLQLLPLLKRGEQQNQQKLIIADLGSGAGLPGLVMSIFDEKNDYYLIDSNNKKCNFLQYIKSSLKLTNTYILNKKVDCCHELENSCNVVTSRAMTSLDKLLKYSQKLLFPTESFCLFLKGKNYKDELDKYKITQPIIIKSISENKEGVILIFSAKDIEKNYPLEINNF